ncbi:membrane protein [Streptomyces resistomycificus]|uniref:Membrane protein n=2 Tax=Streptomyces resistomycificus TaxID=67356 RepID=A0A0L8LC95_9ACTN|nr:membrane protein [Streptomyces resistomycificus]
MALLPPFIRSTRVHVTPTYPVRGLPADDEVLLDAPDDRLGPALVAAGRGEYRAASELLTATRAAADWENRDRYVRRLAAFAGSRDEWYDDWHRAAPHDPDALLVGAQLAVDRAWRSPARAELLREVSPLITAAARGDDRDPVPWRLALDHARGASAGHRYFEELWEAAIRRAPHHYGCHVAALRYLAASWHGSHHACFDFAELAAQDAPAGSFVQALPARAALSYLTDGCGPEVPGARLDAAADRAIAFSTRFPAADPWPAEARNKLMYVLVRLERWADAGEQLRLIGPYATSFPWSRFSDDPLGRFLEIRDLVRHQTASGHPRSGHGGRARSGDH